MEETIPAAEQPVPDQQPVEASMQEVVEEATEEAAVEIADKIIEISEVEISEDETPVL